ncbi:GxxExxY protein [Flaviaesturariibacter aridisoli]|uniref:GxxExxY protein n=1 Tax=Flaviaesturariibacter aridisoli TaxID=2545761 RepID=A0A4R4DYN8_9BACT|nr:GxxExxY protein [Flaviaesturariibacter aridisoli]TCZ68565.1 GxxExxY protein [Flaviaesturariibacter aridisoli]
MLENETAERQELNRICYLIRGAFFEVFKELGPGLLESIYEAALIIELQSRGLQVHRQRPLPVWYKGHKLDVDFRLDLLVEDKVVIELKSVEELHPVFFKQTTSYMRLAKVKVGFLVNFNVPFLKDRKSLVRLVAGF